MNDINHILAEAVNNVETKAKIITIKPVYGGDVNEAFYVETAQQPYFVKINTTAAPDFFTYESAGLEMLRQTGTVAVPDVYADGNIEGTPVLILSWLEGRAVTDTDDRLGRQLARMHQCYGRAFGLSYNNYIGSEIQQNGWHDTWLSFFRDQRLRVQRDKAVQLGVWSKTRDAWFDSLCDRLAEWLPVDVKPSPLHGDLWGGNWLVGPQGQPYLIDPAVFYGHHEFELAFTALFGGYSSRFYEAYQSVQPVGKGYQQRKPLYQLYYLLVHLNSFGEMYGPSVDRILKTYGS